MDIRILEPLGISQALLEELMHPLKEAGHSVTAYPDRNADPEVLVARAKGADIAVIANTPFPNAVLEALPTLKLLDVAFTGVDHVALDTAAEKGITVCNASGYSTETVAELVIGMTIAALRKMTEGDRRTRSGGTNAGIGGREICGRTVGILGLGAIGYRTAKLFQAFGAKVIAYSRTERNEYAAEGIQYVSLEELLKTSDIVSLHLPNTKETKGILSKEKLSLMKKDAVFINCARGSIVDNAALAELLNQEAISYAAIDVYDMEPPIPEEYPLLNAKNTLLTPHQAYLSEEAMVRRAKIVFDNIHAFLAGNPVNVVKR